MKIKLRQKKTKTGYSFYLDYNRSHNRYEFLNLYLLDAEFLKRKLTFIEKNQNKESKIKAELILNKRYAEQQDDVLKLSGVEMKKRRQIRFIDYFDKIMKERESTSDSNLGNWRSARNKLVEYMNGKNPNLAEVDTDFINGFRSHLLKGGSGKRELATNSAISYFTKFRVVLKAAKDEGYYYSNPLRNIKTIAPAETKREFLTIEELRKIKNTPCDDSILKKAFLFSIFTGIRFCDLQRLTWGNIQQSDSTGYFIRFRQKKTAGEVTIFISEEAYRLLGARKNEDALVFNGLHYSAYKNIKLRDWFINAGIYRKVTFHCARHTFATLQLSAGSPLEIVSNLMGHRNLKTTQIYAKITSVRKMEAVNRISLS